MEILLSKSTMPVIQWVAQLLGWLMNGIYELINMIGIPNIALAIILYTIIVYIAMTPIQINQQKQSKVMSIVQPELNEIQKRYKGKRDQVSQMKMQQETSEIYSKYGVSPTGSCLPLLLQLVLLFALYQVIYHIPGYIARISNMFSELATKLVNTNGIQDILTTFVTDNKLTTKFASGVTMTNVTDFLYLLKPAQWVKLESVSQLSSLKPLMIQTAANSKAVNTFANINISESPWDAITGGFKSGSFLIVVVGILIPVLAWFTQWLNYKLMPQQNMKDQPGGSTMQSMNTIMPIFSAVICVSFSMGIGIYWIAGAVIRCVQQVVINRRIAKMDADALIEKNLAKQEKKRQKRGNVVTGNQIRNSAKTNVKNINTTTSAASDKKDNASNGKKVNYKDTKYEPDYLKNAENADPNSLTAKANMVRKFDEKNAKKK